MAVSYIREGANEFVKGVKRGVKQSVKSAKTIAKGAKKVYESGAVFQKSSPYHPAVKRLRKKASLTKKSTMRQTGPSSFTNK